MKIMDIRDNLTNIVDLVDVCRMAILSEEAKTNKGLMQIAGVMYFQIITQLKNLDEDLQQL